MLGDWPWVHRWIEGWAGRVCGGYDYSMEVIDELLTGGPFGERWNGGTRPLGLNMMGCHKAYL